MSGRALILGLTGPAGCGKSTAAGILVERHGFERLRFAGPLKAMLAALLAAGGLDEATIARMIDGDLKEVAAPQLAGRTPRHAMQTLGSEWGRGLLGDTLWTTLTVEAIAARLASGPAARIVVDDVRFPDEASAIAALGGQVVRLVRPGNAARALGPAESAHLSETQAVPASHRLLNDGPPEILATRLEGLLRRLEARPH